MRTLNLQNVLGLVLSLSLTACLNMGGSPQVISNRNTSLTSSPTGSGFNIVKGDLVSKSIEWESEKDGTFMIRLGTYTASNNFLTYCRASNPETGLGGSCDCVLKWKEEGLTVPRVVRVPMIEVQAQYARCKIPEVISKEIASGLKMNVFVAKVGTGNPDSFAVSSSLDLAKGDILIDQPECSQGRDSFGNCLENVYRYACYKQNTLTKPQLTNRLKTFQDASGTSGGALTAVASSRFCSESQANTGSDCATLSGTTKKTSNISYYFNVYTRSPSTITASDGQYACPTVSQPLPNEVGSAHFPLDTHFRLSRQWSDEWSVGIEGPGAVGKSVKKCEVGPPTEEGSSGGGGTPATGVNHGCLGYARAPVESKCTDIKVIKNGVETTVPTFRLRRYLMAMPTVYAADGAPSTNEKAFYDMIYVLDRPVVDAGKRVIGSIQGPKPCNYAFYDSTGATRRDASLNIAEVPGTRFKNGVRRYVATNSPAWLSDPNNAASTSTNWPKNPDGITFPSSDTMSLATINSTDWTKASCAATLPSFRAQRNAATGDIVWDNGQMNLMNDGRLSDLKVTWGGTADSYKSYTNAELAAVGQDLSLKEVHVRPWKPWWPQYVEDTSFQACAPMSDVIVDPPLTAVLAPDNSMRWCANIYPTENPSLSGNALEAANVSFTSHPDGEVNTARGSNQCSNSSHDGAFNKTCDRTARVNSNDAFKSVPLLAPREDIRRMLLQDDSFKCSYTNHATDGSVIGKRTPASGCCGRTTSGAAILRPTAAGSMSTDTAHLEPWDQGFAESVSKADSSSLFCGDATEY